MSGNLALISQSIDSKNHIYVAGAVIIGAVFSILGLHFIDALIGAYIAVRILKDAIGLSREVISSIKGEETDFSEYRIPFEKHYVRIQDRVLQNLDNVFHTGRRVEDEKGAGSFTGKGVQAPVYAYCERVWI